MVMRGQDRHLRNQSVAQSRLISPNFLFMMFSRVSVTTTLLTLLACSGLGRFAHAAVNVRELKGRAINEPRAIWDCPAVWAAVAAELRLNFIGCNRNARSTIRFAFHDAGGYSSINTPYGPASGGADGSLLLSDEELSRPANKIMQGLRNDLLLPLYNKYMGFGVGAADFVQFAGAVATRACPGGPRYKTVVGRQDDATPCPDWTLPPPSGINSSHAVVAQMFAEKGFNERDMAALMGAHSVSKSFAMTSQGIPLGSPQDTSPNNFDVAYFKQTQTLKPPEGVYRFDSDVNMAHPDTLSGQAFTEFGNSYQTWAVAYADAMYRLSITGINPDTAASLTDCSHFVL